MPAQNLLTTGNDYVTLRGGRVLSLLEQLLKGTGITLFCLNLIIIYTLRFTGSLARMSSNILLRYTQIYILIMRNSLDVANYVYIFLPSYN